MMDDLETWTRAALLSNQVRGVIRRRARGGDSHVTLAAEFQVPMAFVASLADEWLVAGDDTVVSGACMGARA